MDLLRKKGAARHQAPPQSQVRGAVLVTRCFHLTVHALHLVWVPCTSALRVPAEDIASGVCAVRVSSGSFLFAAPLPAWPPPLWGNASLSVVSRWGAGLGTRQRDR